MKNIANIFAGIIKNNRILFILLFFAFISFVYCLPDPLFKDPVCTVVIDRNQYLLGARIATDGQWRFPHNESAPDKFAKAIICFEDKRFDSHIGIDPLAFLRAMVKNIKNREIVSGGSTISMQVIRLSRKGRSRSFFEKMIEVFLALRLEMRYSKREILALYASNAPFGGNVVGLDAAAWKHFGRKPSSLSWSEIAMLAVLPNSPALIHPGRNRSQLKAKRDRLLDKLYHTAVIDSLTCFLSKKEELSDEPRTLPDLSPHLTERIRMDNSNKTIAPSVLTSTIDLQVQKNVQSVLNRHHFQLKENGIHNAAALVIDTESGDVLSYVGNTNDSKNEHGNKVDIITSRRSSGSILKPLLFAMMLHDGQLLPNMLIPDVPTSFGNFSPKNFDHQYDGAVPARIALSRSLNIPAARMLNTYGIEKFYKNLKAFGMTTLHKPSEHYGLSLVLGGAETTLWDLGAIYAGMGRLLKNPSAYEGNYSNSLFRPLNFTLKNSVGKKQDKTEAENSLIDAASVWHTFESMGEVVRPDAESNWQNYSSPTKIAWKTGTSFGFRDGWAVGCTPEYVVAVWVGNADGEGRPGLTGISAAAPLLFDIFGILKKTSKWFDLPAHNMTEIKICSKSGHRASELCLETEILFSPLAGTKTSTCPYHQLIHLDSSGRKRVNSECVSPMEMITKSFFILPPSQEIYYKKKNPDYISLPPFQNECIGFKENSMEIIYPSTSRKIYIPVNLDGSPSKTVFQATHHNPSSIVYWHIDDEFTGETKGRHELSLYPEPGQHTLTLIDSKGELLETKFEVIGRPEN
jgi:penicillin-binding protein 1C